MLRFGGQKQVLPGVSVRLLRDCQTPLAMGAQAMAPAVMQSDVERAEASEVQKQSV